MILKVYCKNFGLIWTGSKFGNLRLGDGKSLNKSISQLPSCEYAPSILFMYDVFDWDEQETTPFDAHRKKKETNTPFKWEEENWNHKEEKLIKNRCWIQ